MKTDGLRACFKCYYKLAYCGHLKPKIKSLAPSEAEIPTRSNRGCGKKGHGHFYDFLGISNLVTSYYVDTMGPYCPLQSSNLLALRSLVGPPQGLDYVVSWDKSHKAYFDERNNFVCDDFNVIASPSVGSTSILNAFMTAHIV